MIERSDTPVTGSRVEVTVRNEGWAAAYTPRSAELRLTNDSGDVSVPLAADIRAWTAGSTTTVSTEVCTVPTDRYRVSRRLPAAEPAPNDNPDFAIRTANRGILNADTQQTI